VYSNLIREKSFLSALISYLARNSSIKEVSFGSVISENGKFDVAELIKSVARQNVTIETMIFNTHFCKLNEEDLEKLQQDVQQNYTLKRIQVGRENPFETILKLTVAGRKYLMEDAASKAKRIEVLSNVTDNLSCLFFHLRENPILFCSNVCHLAGKKRKADEAFD